MATMRDDLLRQHVERVAELGDLLDRADSHPFHDHRRLDQVAAVVGKEHTARGGADLVPGPADALQAAGHRRRRLHLDDDVDGAHVDAQLQRRGGDDAGQLAGLEVGLDLGSLLLADRAVVGPGDHRVPGAVRRRARAGLRHDLGGRRRARGLASPSRSACSSLRWAVSRSASRRELANTIVERWAADQVEDLVLHVRPDRRSVGGARPSGVERLVQTRLRGTEAVAPRSLMSSTGTTIDRSHDFSAGGATTVTGCGPPRKAATRSGGRTVADSPTRWVGPSSSVRLSATRASSRSRERARWAPALGAGHGVHLVDDHRRARCAGCPGPPRSRSGTATPGW